MAEMVGELARTIPLQSLLDEAKREPLKTLAAWPIGEVRRACLNELRRNPYGRIGEELSCDRIEGLIRGFKKANDNLFWEELLNWYVYYAGEGKTFDTSVGARAVEFAIAFSGEGSGVLHEVAKAVSDKLRHRPRLYWEMSAMQEFTELLLTAVRNDRNGYSAGAWHLTERAIRRIVDAEDVNFLWHLDELCRLHRDGSVQPRESYQREDPFVLVQNNALLAEAIRRLAAAKEAQTPDLSATVGSALRQKAGLEGSVVVAVDYPSHAPAGDKPGAAVRASLSATRDSEREKLSAVLGDVTVELQSEGSFEIHRQEGESLYREWIQIGGGWHTVTRKLDGHLSCEFLVQFRPGRNRLWLTFRDGETKLAERAIYITFE